VDLALEADCAPATVRAFEFGAPVRSAIERRLQCAYSRLAGDLAASEPGAEPPIETADGGAQADFKAKARG
jgi:hypothetical protein